MNNLEKELHSFREYLTTDESGDCKKPKFQPKKGIDGIQRFNNCYAYAFEQLVQIILQNRNQVILQELTV